MHQIFKFVRKNSTSVNNFEIIKFLVENGADLNDKSPEGYTPLLYAIENDNRQIIDYLIEKKQI